MYFVAADKNLNVEQLRKAGYKVRVYHARSFNNGFLESRREYEANNYLLSFSERVSSYGGFTTVEITTPDGGTMKGKFNVPAGQQFNRKRGLEAAIGRAFKAGPFYTLCPATMADDDEIPF